MFFEKQIQKHFGYDSPAVHFGLRTSGPPFPSGLFNPKHCFLLKKIM